jgi:putative FmdB family regulatory protein
VPIYEYRCENGHTFEVMQSMTDDPVSACRQCDAPVQRVFHPVAVHFKGSGFYTTDYGRRKGGGDSSTDGKPDAKETASAKSEGADSSASSTAKDPSASD